jgi:hypothetical protein
MAEEQPPGGTPWGEMPRPDHFQQRPSYGGPPGPNPFGFGPRVDFDAIGRAWQLIVSDMSTWVLGSLLCLLIVYLVQTVIGLPLSMAMQSKLATMPQLKPGENLLDYFAPILPLYAVQIGLGVCAQAVTFVVYGGMMETAVRRMEGRHVGIGDLFSGFSHIGTLLGVGLVLAVLQVVGGLLCCLPYFVVQGVFCLAPILIMRGRAHGLAALGASFQLLRSQWLMATLFVFVAQLVSGLGILACGFGILFTFAIYPISVALTYLNFFPPGTPTTLEHQTPSNYFRG